ncbi:helix-turn-helix domain-containing protein [Micromonospora sp. NPDC000018]|uniref:helix-turn-helix domain-containing protein n=1 Tax=Micromonospora sp. NPDC000018 TaxID=3154239 RepID=UPI00331E86D3
MTQALAGALADDVRRRVFAAIVLGDAAAPAVAERTGLPARQVVTAVRRLVDAGLLADGDGELRVDADRAARSTGSAVPASTPSPPRPGRSWPARPISSWPAGWRA